MSKDDTYYHNQGQEDGAKGGATDFRHHWLNSTEENAAYNRGYAHGAGQYDQKNDRFYHGWCYDENSDAYGAGWESSRRNESGSGK